VADALGALGDERARAPLLALFADEPYVTTRPHEARALLALGARDWSASPPPAEVHTTLTVGSDASRLLVLLSDPAATLDRPSIGEGAVRALELPPGHGGRVRVDLRTSSGGVVALWAISAGRLD
jgi:HEAT repeat protein